MPFWTHERVLIELATAGFYAPLIAGRLKGTYSELDPVIDDNDDLAALNVVAAELASKDPGYVSHEERLRAAFVAMTEGGPPGYREAHMAVRAVNRSLTPRVAQLQWLNDLTSHPSAETAETWYGLQWYLGLVDTLEVGLGDLRRSVSRR